MAVSSLHSTSLSASCNLDPAANFLCPQNPFKIHTRGSLPLFHNSKRSKFHPIVTKKLHISPAPTTKFSLFSCLLPTQNDISKILVKNIATVLLGSLIIAGSLKSRPILAQPVQETERLDRKREDWDAKSSATEEEVMYVKLVQENPKDVVALKMVVDVKMRSGKTKEALEYVERLIKIEPSEMEWRLLQALCYEMLGNLGKAKSLFKNILKQRPLLLRALHGMAMVMHKNQEGPAVFEMLERALEVARLEKRVNEERNIRILIAQMHIVKGDFEEALENFQALVNENPRDFRPYLCQENGTTDS
ncbi:SLOW GREEN 1, chloroplastic [Olea europaea subsp. europaea]|uniref:SLOW GREEN 1, chloroplastic n=1 Tax=Olea europaea subsp. europaea TaxID=158383 RepID=A0A8S0RVL9_OLEEU|nr:SLOW GREEN 1, chloroplastic [Olea europaea subsp. europaea]